MDDYKGKLVALYERYLRDHFRDMVDGDTTRSNILEISESDVFAPFANDPISKQINEFMSELNADISQSVIDEHLEGVIKNILADVREIVDSILMDDDAKNVFEFVSSEVGQKILRNLDMIKESLNKATMVLTMEVLKKWTDPSTSEQVMGFISQLTEDEEDDEEFEDEE